VTLFWRILLPLLCLLLAAPAGTLVRASQKPSSAATPTPMRIYLYAHVDPVNGTDPSGHDISLASVTTAMLGGVAIGGFVAAASDIALGRAITAQSIFEGAAFGAVLGPGTLVPATAAGLGFGGLLAGGSFLPILADPNASARQRGASAALVIASIYGAKAGFDLARVRPSTAGSVDTLQVRISGAMLNYVKQSPVDSPLLIGFLLRSGQLQIFRAPPGTAHLDMVRMGYVSEADVAAGFALGVRNGNITQFFPFSQYNRGLNSSASDINLPPVLSTKILNALGAPDVSQTQLPPPPP